jgi:hypothetical protein
MTEVMEAESLTLGKPDSDLNRCGTNLGCGHHTRTQRFCTLQFYRWENPVIRFCLERLLMPAAKRIGQ